MTERRAALGLLPCAKQWQDAKTNDCAHRQRHSLDKTKDWIKEAAAIVGQSVKSGVGKGPPPDEERPLLPEHAQDPRVSLCPISHLANF